MTIKRARVGDARAEKRSPKIAQIMGTLHASQTGSLTECSRRSQRRRRSRFRRLFGQPAREAGRYNRPRRCLRFGWDLKGCCYFNECTPHRADA
ncbi:unnamed protein product [Protopolystoma xenopodis]|uniref:Uncharacterized protein n=1 Tax=Protopolystoma xenopodis TaxID=117903 RepID=A0A448XPS0_9PLAT|nr:unnamed protein product [Protopolystoma xenopodis]